MLLPGGPRIGAVAMETGSSAFSPADGNTALELRIRRLLPHLGGLASKGKAPKRK